MKKKKFDALLTGIICACGFTLSLLLLIMPKSVFVSIGIVIICLSLATGMLLPNPISFLGLFAGILVTVLPPWLIALVYICFAIAGMIINVLNRAWQEASL